MAAVALGGIPEIGQVDDRLCLAVWHSLRMRDPHRLAGVVDALARPVPVAVDSRLVVMPTLCAMPAQTQVRWLALLHSPGVPSCHYRRLVTACADHVSDPCSRLLLDSLARRHGSSYRSPDVKQAADWPNLWQDDSNDVDMEDDVSGMASPPASQADVAVASQPSVPLITDEQRSLIDNIQSAIDEGHCRCEESMEWLRNATPDVVRHVLAKMDMLSRPDAILDTFARALVNADTNFETCAAVIDCCLLPRVLALTSGPASRMLFEMVAGLAKQHTRAFVSHLLCPLLGQLSSPSQSELLGRITRDCLADQDRALLLQHALTLQSWTEETIKVVYILVQSGVSMTAIIASNLVACIATIAADQQLCKAVKFPALIVALANKHGALMREHRVVLLDACERLQNFMKKVAIKSVQNIS